MPVPKLTQDQRADIRKRIKAGTPARVLAEEFQVTVGTIYKAAPVGKAERRIDWPQWKIDELRRVYADVDNKALAKQFGCTIPALKRMAHLHGIRKSDAAMVRMYQARGEIISAMHARSKIQAPSQQAGMTKRALIHKDSCMRTPAPPAAAITAREEAIPGQVVTARSIITIQGNVLTHRLR